MFLTLPIPPFQEGRVITKRGGDMNQEKKETSICPKCGKLIRKIIESGFGGREDERCECEKIKTGFGN